MYTVLLQASLNLQLMSLTGAYFWHIFCLLCAWQVSQQIHGLCVTLAIICNLFRWQLEVSINKVVPTGVHPFSLKISFLGKFLCFAASCSVPILGASFMLQIWWKFKSMSMTLPRLLLLWLYFVVFGQLERINLTCKVSFVGTFHSLCPSTYILAMKNIVVGRAPFRTPPKLVAIFIDIRMSAVWNLFMDLFVSGTFFMILSFKVWYGKPLKLLLKSF